MPGALIYTMITWAISPMAPQVLGITLGSPLCPCCCNTPHGEVRNKKLFVEFEVHTLGLHILKCLNSGDMVWIWETDTTTFFTYYDLAIGLQILLQCYHLFLPNTIHR